MTSADAANNSVTEPVVTSDPLSFATPAPVCFLDDTAADFGAGTTDANTIVTSSANGEVTLKPSVDAEFAALAADDGWQSFPFAAGGTATVAGGF